MSNGHLTLAEIAEASRWPADDTRRRHLDECARCRMLCMRHEQFAAAPTHVPAADVRDAEARLDAFLAREILAGTPADAVPRPVRAIRERRVGRGPFAWLLTPAFATAAVVLVVAGVIVASRVGGPDGRPSGVLRGQGPGGGGVAVQRLASTALRGDRVELRWRALPAAERYEVRLFSPELRTLAVLGTTRETVLVVSASTLAGTASGDTLLWRVTAIRGEVQIARSDLGTVRLP